MANPIEIPCSSSRPSQCIQSLEHSCWQEDENEKEDLNPKLLVGLVRIVPILPRPWTGRVVTAARSLCTIADPPAVLLELGLVGRGIRRPSMARPHPLEGERTRQAGPINLAADTKQVWNLVPNPSSQPEQAVLARRR
ncbi:hypothetical protein GGTG_02721 [Gaeumannomyces tritici R3-111a-1]|uniref:Uncharacterized protein n=1 Tax=Gaeumannomyces tritici (strain R3-111a-1) TaxID=644352 RepID=J3NN63_GAET3|nr:hypothetical protein GGTG_02721 [Gaeumannomyces tritici R3-111a-1]EJT77615.1 hypothetical protein GGTG_02721 [Gaeumannomyces tritici R3-111a-1]